jgi:hypothetical protein
MALTAQGYFNCLKSYLNTHHNGMRPARPDEIVLKEKVFGQRGSKPKEYKVALKTVGEVLVIKLDTKKNGSIAPFFHFLNDNSKPWSKRCDFVVFNLRKGKLFVYCLEFKSESVPRDVKDQLKASVDWVKVLHSTLNAYTANKFRLNATKYVLSAGQNPQPYLDAEKKYLQRDHTVRHYLYKDINGMALADLENSNIELIR